MTRRSQLSTRTLLICAAIAVGTGLLSAVAGFLSIPTIATVPLLYGLVLSMHLLPGIVSQALLKLPWVALITHVLAGLVAAAVSPLWIKEYALAIVLMGGIQEGWAAIRRYRNFSTPYLIAGGAVLGLVLGLSAGLAIGLKHFDPIVAIASIGIYVVGAAAWTWVGIAIANAMTKAGLARSVRR